MTQNVTDLPEQNINGLPTKDNCIYTPHFCEENIWMLVKQIRDNTPEKLKYCFPVFISNEVKFIPLWRQSVSKQKDGLVAWDYHVIMVYSDSDRSFVYDFDTQLPFPSLFLRYCDETFKSDVLLQPQYHRLFRVICAEMYLNNFSSDRSHMKKEDGSWLKPPPAYPCIINGGENHNLPKYISMQEDGQSSKYGHIFSLNNFINKFSKHSEANYLYPPEPSQPSWLE